MIENNNFVNEEEVKTFSNKLSQIKEEAEDDYKEVFNSLKQLTTIYFDVFANDQAFREKWLDENSRELDFNTEDYYRIIDSIIEQPQETFAKTDSKNYEKIKISSGETIISPYPVTEVILSFWESLKDPDTILMVTDEQGEVFRLSIKNLLKENQNIVGFSRIRKIVENKEDSLFEEMSHYVTREQFSESIFPLFDSSLPIILLGEIAILEKYRTNLSLSKATLDVFVKEFEYPPQGMFFTKKGSGTHGKLREKTESSVLIALVNRQMRNSGFVYLDKSMTVDDLIIHILKRNERNN